MTKNKQKVKSGCVMPWQKQALDSRRCGVTSDSINLLTLSLGFLFCKMGMKGLMSELNQRK